MDFIALAQECAPWVAHETMAAIVRTESAFRPLAIGVNGGARLARQPENKAEAVATAEWLIANGYNIDMGLGQVNSTNLRKTGLTVEDAFDACKNIAAAATILHWNYQAASRKVQGEQAALHAALSAYNTGSFTRGFSNGYVQKVVNNAGAASAVPVVAPIPLLGAKAPKAAPKPAVKPRQTQAAPDAPVRLQAEGQQAAEGDGASVYGGGSTQSVMVY
ncbi:Type IV secretion system protein virB1 (plasmid) [Sterolibacterium denitrificans]|uniref:Type IV secretion system protein virB1 n=1 Tax=Sterolibacterium denitrificans TaxID=157592 RepID=A0A7Z7HTC8_9PROT|nr:lytic transglycosylase domain-containing protein [Sterolibacterium denitrificans]SMB33265.1 Type IV secretion system protein virB1 [Sterolibacterium denitrificans]